MQTGILRVLRATAASWWRRKELRRTGQVDLARSLERETIRRDLGYLRLAKTLPNAHIVCGAGGTFIHLGWTTVSTYAPVERFPLAALAIALGTPFIDIRAVSDVIALAKLPCVVRGPSDEDASGHSLTRVPLATYLNLIEPLGALITNDPRNQRDL
ncbi:hypothetical protein [Litoreibacter roseus]|uniref:Uncharacterized protein n=1 Tax=Litoreibacter roseus TaxID=2601869 RepID=A0A6N6JM70_9RHOB|nr:hypothetical protein [Litoreibacter roseus]GFE67234.1 hypothetical protein KIN_43080 [Litoreibacter roseus]